MKTKDQEKKGHAAKKLTVNGRVRGPHIDLRITFEENARIQKLGRLLKRRLPGMFRRHLDRSLDELERK